MRWHTLLVFLLLFCLIRRVDCSLVKTSEYPWQEILHDKSRHNSKFITENTIISNSSFLIIRFLDYITIFTSSWSTGLRCGHKCIAWSALSSLIDKLSENYRNLPGNRLTWQTCLDFRGLPLLACDDFICKA